MAIKDASTYGEYYWSMQVEAQKLFAKDVEKELSSMAAQLMGSLKMQEFLPPEFTSLFSGISAPVGAFLGDVGGRFVSEVADGAVSQAASPFFESMGYAAYNLSPTKKMTPAATAILFSRKKIGEEFFKERFRMGGFEPIEAQFQYDSMRPYPSITDLVLYSRYHGDPENVWATLEEFYDVAPVDFKLWEWLGRQRLSTLDVQTLFRREILTEEGFFDSVARIGWDKYDAPMIMELGWTIPNAMLLVQGNLHQGKSTEEILKDISIADINPRYAQQYLDAILTKPASQDLIAYHLRKDPTLSGLEDALQRIGIHPDFTDVYKTLAYPIPPVADIITMAVREAFSPEIASRFGQYEDYPAEFEEWAKKKGISKEWSERYWAAHWSLPSASQGFEMLHRGVIDNDELNMLLRALDIMPFWRKKLTNIAFKRLTRVDIRRMYRVGVMDEAEVYDAYLELGYNERDSRRMSDFTVKQTLATQSKFTERDIISAYLKYMINRSETKQLLQLVGVREENIAFILSTAEYKREWALTDAKIDAIRNLYKRETYDANKARAELLKLDLPAERVDVLMAQWFVDEKDKPPRYWTTAQTLSFIEAGAITEERGIQELRDIGYNTEHITAYLGKSE